MLTKEKVQSICQAPLTMEDKLIKIVIGEKGIVSKKTIIEKYSIMAASINLTVKDSYYLEATRGKNPLIKINYKGKEYKGLYAIPERADNLENMVFSMLYLNFGLSFQDSLKRVIDFCKAKNLNYIAYLQNRNCFDTIKKQVGKYLDMQLENRPYNWHTVTSETLYAWKKRKRIK